MDFETEINAPFTEEQVEKLKKYQENGKFHPFTCCSQGSNEKCERKNGVGEGLLIPSTEGWVCPCGEIKQNWCHKFMVE
jgi:hypothetical protein